MRVFLSLGLHFPGIMPYPEARCYCSVASIHLIAEKEPSRKLRGREDREEEAEV
jgi:hypothetical protein